MANFPTSKDDATSLPNPSGVSTQNNPDHGSLHTNENAAIIALETKVGTGSSTPASNTLLIGTGAGTSAWSAITSSQLASILSDETGSGSAVFATTPTLVTPKVDTINEATAGNGVTVGGVNLKSGAISTSNAVPTAALQDSSITFAKVAPGAVVQVASTNFSAVATGTTLIPYDDTIPQITEGTEFMTQAITPKASTNLLIIEAQATASYSVLATVCMALFQDTTASALAATANVEDNGAGLYSYKLRFRMIANTTSSTTFRVRIGAETAGTATFNGSAGSRKYGGISLSNITITEYKI